VFDVLDKHDFDPRSFLDAVRGALFTARLKRAKARQAQLYAFTFTFTEIRLTALELTGPGRRQPYPLLVPALLRVDDLSRRSDQLGEFLAPDVPIRLHQEWRKEARSIGQDLYNWLTTSDSRLLAELTLARNLPARNDGLLLRLQGSRPLLRVPFELLHDGTDYLALSHLLVRQIVDIPLASRKVEPFDAFLAQLHKSQKKLRVLLIGANVGPPIEAVEQEVAGLTNLFTTALSQMGVESQVEVLSGAAATYAKVEAALRNSSFHIIHYAGHGAFDAEVPERSSLCVCDGPQGRAVTASTLKTWLQNSSTQLVYLSSCLGSRTAVGGGRGDFLGIMDALVQADIPTVLGYRWEVGDRSAARLALAFYESLLDTFSPVDALLQARTQLAAEYGRDDDTWVSPILVAQNA
jgi:CHAT domain-containing protein